MKLWLIELSKQNSDENFRALFENLFKFTKKELRSYPGIELHSGNFVELFGEPSWSYLEVSGRYDGLEIASKIASAPDKGVYPDDIKICITNVELDPGPKYNFRFFSRLEKYNSYVMSVRPLDPDYWGEEIKQSRSMANIGDKTQILLRRATSALLRLIATIFGLKTYCLRPYCFLYGNLDSDPDPVLLLSKLSRFCEYHNIQLSKVSGDRK